MFKFELIFEGHQMFIFCNYTSKQSFIIRIKENFKKKV